MATEIKHEESGKKATAYLDEAASETFDSIAKVWREANIRSDEAEAEKKEARLKIIELVDQTFEADDFNRTRIVKGKSFWLKFSKGTPSKKKEKVNYDAFWAEAAKIVPQDVLQELLNLRDSHTTVEDTTEIRGKIMSIEPIGGNEMIEPDD